MAVRWDAATRMRLLGERVLREDFAQFADGLSLPAQRKKLAELHAWLVDEGRMGHGERVLALTNYQQGRFGRMPIHILLVTTARIAYTQDDGLRSIALADVDTGRIGVSAGVVHGKITIPLRDGGSLTFRRGKSLAMAEVAGALRLHGCPSPDVRRDRSPRHRRQ